jgi:hypothetical protein
LADRCDWRCRWAPRYSPPTTTFSAVVARPGLSNAVGRAATGVTRRNLKPSVVVLPGQRDRKGAAELRRHPRPAHQSPARVCDLADVHRPSDGPVPVAEEEGDLVHAFAGEQRARRRCAGTSASTGASLAGPEPGCPRGPPRGGLRRPGVRHRGRHVAALRGGRVRRCAAAAAGRCRWRTRSYQPTGISRRSSGDRARGRARPGSGPSAPSRRSWWSGDFRDDRPASRTQSRRRRDRRSARRPTSVRTAPRSELRSAPPR